MFSKIKSESYALISNADDEAELAGAKSIQMLQTKITALQGEIQELLHQNSQR